MMKFRRRESEHGEFRKEEARPIPRSTGKRAMTGMNADSLQGSPEPTPVSVDGRSSIVSTPGNSSDTSNITTQTPDNVIGETLVVQGRVEFQNLLRIDGHFEGELIGHGSLIIGPTAEVISNLTGLHEVYVEGILIGDCSCNKMQIRFAGCVTGNLQCASLGMDPSVVLKGSANINPREKTDKPRSKHGVSRKQSSRSQSRTSDDGSTKVSASSHSPESVVSRNTTHEGHRSKGSGDLRPEGGEHKVSMSGDSTESVPLTDDVPLPLPPTNGSVSAEQHVPKVNGVDAVKIPVRPAAPVRARPPVHGSNAVA